MKTSSTLFILLIMVSCIDEDDIKFEQTVKKKVESHISNLKNNLKNNEKISKIDEVGKSIIFSTIRSYISESKGSYIIFDLNSNNSSINEKESVLFFLDKEGNINRFYILSLKTSTHSKSGDRLISSLLDSKIDRGAFTGVLSIYNPYHELILKSEFGNGNFLSYGLVSNKLNEQGSKHRKLGYTCINWYLETTYYFSDGSTTTTSEFLKTTCTLECQVGINCDDPSDPYESGGSIDQIYFAQTIENNVTNPCISQQVNAAISNNIANEISSLIRNIYNTSDKINLEIDQVDYLTANIDAITDGYLSGNGDLNISISFNGNTMPNASKEYIMATLYHEFLHAIMNYNGISNSQQHQTMATGYINILTNALIEHFPGLSMDEAVKLSWGGLQSTAAWDNLSATEKSNIISTNLAHKSSELGTDCN